MDYFQKKKQFFMSIVNQVKGFVRTVSGVPPITLENCVDDKSVIDYKIYGNSVQDGESSPDNPVEVVSIGEKTENLVDFYDAFTKPNYIYTSGNIRYKHIQLEAYTEYTLSTNAEKTTTTTGTPTYQIFIGSGQLQSVTGAANGVSVDNSRTITTDADGYLTIAIRANDGKDVVTEEEILNGIKWIMLNKTSVALPYEPFGYKIPITASGKNLFDISNTSGWKTISYRYYSIYVGANKTVGISWDNDLSGGQGFYLCVGRKNSEKGGGNVQDKQWLYHSTTTYLNKNTIKVTADAEGYIYINMQPLNLNKLMKLRVECSEPITTNIYLDEPLRAIGDYKDYIDSEKQQVVRKIYHEFLDTVTTMSSESTTYKRFLTDISKKPFLSNAGGNTGDTIGHTISNKFKKSTYTYNRLGRELKSINSIQSYITTTGINRVAYVFDDSSITTVAQAQEKIGDGFDVCYVLEKEIEEYIELPKIETVDKITRVEVLTNIYPSEIEISY